MLATVRKLLAYEQKGALSGNFCLLDCRNWIFCPCHHLLLLPKRLQCMSILSRPQRQQYILARQPWYCIR